jgi:ribonuclease VapC
VILDTSAVLAILNLEPEAETFTRRIVEAEVVRMSVANWLELMMVSQGKYGTATALEAEDYVVAAGVVIEPVTVEHGRIARQAFLKFGRGRHPAKLNFGDCFAYALAKATGEPLLFKGDDFAQTDVTAA